MSQAKQYLFKPSAEKDLEGIYDYTLKKFGETQADVYIRDLFDTFDRIMHSPLLARHRNEIREGLRSYLFKSHCIFFREVENGILIVRVLHQSMDHQSHSF